MKECDACVPILGDQNGDAGLKDPGAATCVSDRLKMSFYTPASCFAQTLIRHRIVAVGFMTS